MLQQLFPLAPVSDTFRKVPKVIGMVHALALPGTPGYQSSNIDRNNSGIQKILDQAKREAEIFSSYDGTLHIQFCDPMR